MLYEWPKGRILRTVLLVVTLAIAVDFGRSAWGSLYPALSGSPNAPALVTQVWGWIFAAIAVVVFAIGFYLIGFRPSTAKYLIEVEAEVTKVTWPKHREIVRSTAIIAILTAAMGVAIWLIDTLWVQVVYNWLRVGGGVA
jgi:preprotein translocase SecE subunit